MDCQSDGSLREVVTFDWGGGEIKIVGEEEEKEEKEENKIVVRVEPLEQVYPRCNARAIT